MCLCNVSWRYSSNLNSYFPPFIVVVGLLNMNVQFIIEMCT